MFTDFRKWLSFAGWRERGGQTTTRPGRTFRPCLETLEERTLLNAGSLDPAFGTGGVASIPVSGLLPSIVVEPDGKRLLVTSQWEWSEAGQQELFQVTRENADGSLDTTFGQGGIVSLPAMEGFSTLAVQPDGKILLPFWFGPDAPVMPSGILRLNSNGSLDTSFGTGGVLFPPVWIYGMAVQPDGKMVVEGQDPYLPNAPTALLRYDANGQLDPTFGTGGVVLTPLTYPSASMALSPDGKILLAGETGNASPDNLGPSQPSSASLTSVVRYDADGSLDASFGKDGVASTPLDYGWQLLVQPDGDVLVGNPFTVTMVRLTPDGALDSTFGDGGVLQPNINNPLSADPQWLVEGDGKILLAYNNFGQTMATVYDGEVRLPLENENIVLARYDSDGSVDSSFGDNGQVTTTFGQSLASSLGMTLAPDGEIDMLAYTTSALYLTQVVQARFETDAPPLPVTLFSVNGPSPGVYAAGQSLTYTVAYSAPVTVSGTPEIEVDLYTHQGGPFGPNSVQQVEAVYSGGSGTNELTFTYVVQPSDGGPPTAYDPPSGAVAESPIQLDGGSITDANGDPVSLDFTAPDGGGVHVYGLAPPPVDPGDSSPGSNGAGASAGNTNNSPLPAGSSPGPGAILTVQQLANLLPGGSGDLGLAEARAILAEWLQAISGPSPFNTPVTGGVGPTDSDPLGTRLLGGDGSDVLAEPWWAALPAAAPVEAVAWTGEEAALLTAEAGAVGDAPVALHDTVFLTPLPTEGDRQSIPADVRNHQGRLSVAAEGDRLIPSSADGGADTETLGLAVALLAAQVSLHAPPSRQGRPIVRAALADRRV